MALNAVKCNHSASLSWKGLKRNILGGTSN